MTTTFELYPLAGLVAIGLLAGASGGVHAQATVAAPPEQIERVVITSEKRVGMMDETPASITALFGTSLAETGATALADVLALSPNTSFSSVTGTSQIFVRGIGNVFVLAGGDPGVALYSDGSYVSDLTSVNVSLFDVQRVEILRGPQGALYGRNATGGAVNLISVRPVATFQARAGMLLGDYGRKETEGFVSGPLTASTAGRLSWQVKQLDGYTRNPLAGTVNGGVLPGDPPSVGPRRLDDLDSRAVRLQSSTDFGGGGTLRIIGGHYREKEAGAGMQLLLDPVMVPELLYGVRPSSDPRVQKSQGASNVIEVNSLQAILERPVGSSRLRATAGWRHSAAGRAWDADGTEALVVNIGITTRSTDKSVDLHLISDDSGPTQWLVGATWLQFDQQQDVHSSTQVPLGFLVAGAPLNVPLPGGVAFDLGGKVYTTSAAVYADLRHALTSRLSLLGGLRINHDRKRADEYLQVAAFGVDGRDSPRDSWTSTPASVGLEYRVDEDSLTYGRLASSFKSGAVNLGSLQGQLVKPEKSVGVELGYKTGFWQRRGALRAAMFSTDYKDMQVSQVGEATVILANASRARIQGLELEIGVRPSARLMLSAGIGLMDPTYSDFVNADARNRTPPVNVKGRQLALVSRQQATLGAEYAPDLGSLRAQFRADYVWRSRLFFTEFNTPDAMQDGYGLLHLSASVRAVNGQWKVYAYLRNVTDKTAITSMSIGSPLLGAVRLVNYTPPRLFGIGTTIDF